MQHQPLEVIVTKLFIIFALALATGCSSTREYERGAYAPAVPAPTFSPAQDAPHTTGQPGYLPVPRAPRGTDRRIAPARPYPQMMAADGDERRAILLLLDEPVANPGTDSITQRDFAACWKDFKALAEKWRADVLKMSKAEVLCLRHKVLAHCGARKNERKAKAERTPYDGTWEDIMANAHHQRHVCGPDDLYESDRVVKLWNKMLDEGDDHMGWRP
jgi:hypothetical protein